MVERYSLPSLLINGEHRLVHLSVRAGRYMSHPGGAPTTNVFKLVKDELIVELRTVLDRAGENPALPDRRRPDRGHCADFLRYHGTQAR